MRGSAGQAAPHACRARWRKRRPERFATWRSWPPFRATWIVAATSYRPGPPRQGAKQRLWDAAARTASWGNHRAESAAEPRDPPTWRRTRAESPEVPASRKWVTEFKFRAYAAREQRSTRDRMIFFDSGSQVGVCKKVSRRHWRRRVVSMSANEGSRFWRYHGRRGKETP